MADVDVVIFVFLAFFLGYYLGWFSRGKYSGLERTKTLGKRARRIVQ